MLVHGVEQKGHCQAACLAHECSTRAWQSLHKPVLLQGAQCTSTSSMAPSNGEQQRGEEFRMETGARQLLWFGHAQPTNFGAKIAQSEKVHHPKLKHHFLSFQPSDTTIPTWILSNTNRRLRNLPQIVMG